MLGNGAMVGIGTSTPQYALDVQGTGNFTGAVTVAGLTSGDCVQAGAGGLLTTTASPCGSGGGGTGTVTSVGSGAGLTGGPITTSGTLSIATGGVTNGMLTNSSLTVMPGTDLTGGGVVALGGSITLNLDTTQVPQLGTPNTFAATQTISSGNLALPDTSGTGTAGVLTINGNPFLHDCCGAANGNVFLGRAGNFTTTGNQDTAGGFKALVSNTTGGANTASGYEALFSNTTGSFNTAVGYAAGVNLSASLPTTGSNSTFLGADATATLDGLTNATAIGYNAQVGESNALVLGNGAMVGIGTSTPQYTLDVHGAGNFTGAVTVAGLASGDCVQAGAGGLLATTASPCGSGGGGGTITGVTAGTDLTGGGTSGMVTLGVDTTKVPQLGTPNTFAGTQTIGTGDLSVSNGNLDLPGTTAATAGVINLGGTPFLHDCCFVGDIGFSNTFVGLLAGNFSSTGYYNTASGTGALVSNTTGTANTASGTGALYSNTTGNYNTAVGYEAGANLVTFIPTTGSNSTFVGANATATVDGLTNATAIGAYAQVGEEQRAGARRHRQLRSEGGHRRQRAFRCVGYQQHHRDEHSGGPEQRHQQVPRGLKPARATSTAVPRPAARTSPSRWRCAAIARSTSPATCW